MNTVIAVYYNSYVNTRLDCRSGLTHHGSKSGAVCEDVPKRSDAGTFNLCKAKAFYSVVLLPVELYLITNIAIGRRRSIQFQMRGQVVIDRSLVVARAGSFLRG